MKLFTLNREITSLLFLLFFIILLEVDKVTNVRLKAKSELNLGEGMYMQNQMEMGIQNQIGLGMENTLQEQSKDQLGAQAGEQLSEELKDQNGLQVEAKLEAQAQTKVQDKLEIQEQIRAQALERERLQATSGSTAKLKLIILNGIVGKDVGSGIMDSTWICGLDGRIYRYDPMNVVHNILNQPPPCNRIAIDYEGLPWIITKGHKVWRLMHEYNENFRWVQAEGKFFNIGCGIDIGAALNGDVFIVGCGRGPFGYPLYRWNRANDSFCILDGSGIRIDASPNGSVWLVNRYGNIYKRENNNYAQIDGIGWDITVANNGDVYHRGNEYSIWKRIAGDWERVDGYAASLSAGDSLWCVRSDGAVLH